MFFISVVILMLQILFSLELRAVHQVVPWSQFLSRAKASAACTFVIHWTESPQILFCRQSVLIPMSCSGDCHFSL
jgi:hypothetical protein